MLAWLLYCIFSRYALRFSWFAHFAAHASRISERQLSAMAEVVIAIAGVHTDIYCPSRWKRQCLIIHFMRAFSHRVLSTDMRQLLSSLYLWWISHIASQYLEEMISLVNKAFWFQRPSRDFYCFASCIGSILTHWRKYDAAPGYLASATQQTRWYYLKRLYSRGSDFDIAFRLTVLRDELTALEISCPFWHKA